MGEQTPLAFIVVWQAFDLIGIPRRARSSDRAGLGQQRGHHLG